MKEKIKKITPKVTEEEVKESSINPGFEVLKNFVESEDHKGTNYGFVVGGDLEDVEDEYISTGSVRFDSVLGGGYRPGMSLFYGEAETGKTAQGLVWAKNWQDKFGEKGLVVFFDAEGRLSKYKIKMSGIDMNRFAHYKGNMGERIYDSIEKTILNNKGNYRYFFILDSIDSIVRAEDKVKSFSESNKIAGGAALNSAAYKRLSAPIHCLGHHLYICSQIRTQNITGKPAGSKASGGKAPMFYGDIVGKINKGWSDTYFTDSEGRVIGNKTNMEIMKSYNETTHYKMDIPILYKYKGGIWREYEAFMVCLEWCWIEKGGAWYSFTDIFKNFVNLAIPDKYDLSKKIQGEKNLLEFLTENQELVEFIFAKFKTLTE